MNSNQTVGQIVAEDFRKAAIFKHYGIDFCCGGGRTLVESCESKGVDPQEVAAALEELEQSAFAPEADVVFDAKGVRREVARTCALGE